MERVCEYARTLIRRCFCGDDEDDSQVADLGSGVTQVHTVITELSPVTRDIRSAGLVPELRDESETQDRGEEGILGSVSERGPVLVDNVVEGRLTTIPSVDEEDDSVRPFVTSPNVSWFGQQLSTANEVTEESPAIVELTAEEENSSCTTAHEGSEIIRQEGAGDVLVNVGDPATDSETGNVNNFFKLPTWICIVPHDVTTSNRIGSKWGIAQKITVLVAVGLALLRPLSYLKATYLDTISSKTDVVYYGAFAIQLVTFCTYMVTSSRGDVNKFLDGLTGMISIKYTLLPASAIFLALFAALFDGWLPNLSEWSFESESKYHAQHMKTFFLQWETGNETQVLSDKWVTLDAAFGVTGFLSKYTAYYLDYFIQDMFLVISVTNLADSKRFTNDIKNLFESDNENRNGAVEELVRNYEKLQEKKDRFNKAFGGLFDCFHFRNLFRCVYFVYGMVEKEGFWDLAFHSIPAAKTWTVYYLASTVTQLVIFSTASYLRSEFLTNTNGSNGEFRHLISKNLEVFTKAVGETKVNFLLNDILVNPVGLGDGVSFVDGRFISELISMIATYVVILVTNKD